MIDRSTVRLPHAGRLLAVVLLLVLAVPAGAADTPWGDIKQRYSGIVMDADTGAILYERAADAPRYPASLTKLMTLYLTFDALRAGRLSFSDRLAVSRHAAAQPPSKLGLKAGQSIGVDKAILALVTKSANDVAVVLAEAIGGTERGFAAMMTKRARQLGMRVTVFRNASGLHNGGQVSSARDMATLARALVRDFPLEYRYFRTKRFQWRGRTIATHNGVLKAYPGADGLKTGYVHASGYNLATSAVRGGRRLIGVVFGGHAPAWRDRHMMALLNQGFRRIGIGGRTASVPSRYATPPRDDDRPKPRYRTAQVPPGGDPNGPWSVQVGAYAQASLAHRHATEAMAAVADLAPSARPFVLAVRVDGQTLYRARIVGASRSMAVAACTRLKRVHGDCFLVPPGEDGREMAAAN